MASSGGVRMKSGAYRPALDVGMALLGLPMARQPELLARQMDLQDASAHLVQRMVDSYSDLATWATAPGGPKRYAAPMRQLRRDIVTDRLMAQKSHMRNRAIDRAEHRAILAA